MGLGLDAGTRDGSAHCMAVEYFIFGERCSGGPQGDEFHFCRLRGLYFLDIVTYAS